MTRTPIKSSPTGDSLTLRVEFPLTRAALIDHLAQAAIYTGYTDLDAVRLSRIEVLARVRDLLAAQAWQNVTTLTRWGRARAWAEREVAKFWPADPQPTPQRYVPRLTGERGPDDQPLYGVCDTANGLWICTHGGQDDLYQLARFAGPEDEAIRLAAKVNILATRTDRAATIHRVALSEPTADLGQGPIVLTAISPDHLDSDIRFASYGQLLRWCARTGHGSEEHLGRVCTLIAQSSEEVTALNDGYDCERFANVYQRSITLPDLRRLDALKARYLRYCHYVREVMPEWVTEEVITAPDGSVGQRQRDRWGNTRTVTPMAAQEFLSR